MAIIYHVPSAAPMVGFFGTGVPLTVKMTYKLREMAQYVLTDPLLYGLFWMVDVKNGQKRLRNIHNLWLHEFPILES